MKRTHRIESLLLIFLLSVSLGLGQVMGQEHTPEKGLEELKVADLEIRPEQITESDQKAIQRLETELETLRLRLNIPGMSAAVVKDEKILWSKGFGFADLENKVKSTKHTPYRLGSVTKTFSSTILIELLEQGKINLDDPIEKYGILMESPGTIKIRHLMNHTSEGIPGTRYHYNGHRFALLGKVIRKVTGKSYRELLIEEIINPLGLTHTAPHRCEWDRFFYSLGFCKEEEKFDHVYQELAKPYKTDKTNKIVRGEHPDAFNAAAGLITSVMDMARYDIAIDRHLFVKKETQEMAYTPAVSNTNRTLPYGLGWFINLYKGKRFILHFGEWHCVGALILKVPEDKLTFIVFANSRNLNRYFNIGYGDPTTHSAALAFLKTFVYPFKEDVPIVDWEGDENQIKTTLSNVTDPDLREILKRELKVNHRVLAIMRNKEKKLQLVRVSSQVFSKNELAEAKDWGIIARIDQVKDKERKSVDLKLDKEETFCVYAIGESDYTRMHDYAFIQNEDTAEIMWEMRVPDSTHAGGALKNRKIHQRITLPAGNYKLNYRADDNHSFGNWNDLPPDHLFWGVVLYRYKTSPTQQNLVEYQRVIPVGSTGNVNRRGKGSFLSPLQYIFLGLIGLLYLSAFLTWPFGYAERRFRSWVLKRPYEPLERRRLPRIGRALVFPSGLLYLVMVLSLKGIEFGVKNGIVPNENCFALIQNTQIILPGLLALVTIFMILVTLLAWKFEYWCWKRRVHYSLITMASIATILFLNHWHLL
jgi:CubicO group peptidase (beta-lactamase class C family)